MSFWKTIGKIGKGLLSATPIIGDVVGGLLASDSQKKANETNLQIARENRQWQQQMSSTAHQREVADLKKAGINPLLTATGGPGASTPQGSVATMAPEIPPEIMKAMMGSQLNQHKIIRHQADEAKESAKITEYSRRLTGLQLRTADLVFERFKKLMKLKKNLGGIGTFIDLLSDTWSGGAGVRGIIPSRRGGGITINR